MKRQQQQRAGDDVTSHQQQQQPAAVSMTTVVKETGSDANKENDPPSTARLGLQITSSATKMHAVSWRPK